MGTRILTDLIRHTPDLSQSIHYESVHTTYFSRLKAGLKQDYHWDPIFDICAMCNVGYDVIEKFETLERDHHYLLHQLGKNGCKKTYVHVSHFPLHV